MKRITPTRNLIFALMILIAATFVAMAHGQIDTLDTEAESITFSLAGQNTNSMTAITAGRPIDQL